MEAENNKKISFFERVKIAVAKLENYNVFLEEKTSVAVKYFFILLLIFSILLGVVETYSFMKSVNRGYKYIKNELPDFSYTDGTLTFSQDVNAYDEELDLKMISDTSDEITDEQIQKYKEDIKSLGILFLKDKLIYFSAGNEISYTYTELASEYQITTLDKTQLIEKIDSIGIGGIASTIFLVLTMTLYIVNIFSMFIDWLIITIFAYCVSRICRINMIFKQVFNISIYALTLSIILSLVYNIAYYVAGFYTDYFRMVYLLISYVYVVAAILMIKSDLMKQQVEVQKIVEVQKEVHDEINIPEEEQEKKEKKQKEGKDDKKEKENEPNIDGEPDGSEI